MKNYTVRVSIPTPPETCTQYLMSFDFIPTDNTKRRVHYGIGIPKNEFLTFDEILAAFGRELERLMNKHLDLNTGSEPWVK